MPQQKTMTSCWRTIRRAGGFNERGHGSDAASHDPAVCQTTATGHDRGTVRNGGGTSDQTEAEPSQLSGSVVRDGSGKTRTQYSGATHQGCALSESEDAGRVRVPRCPAHPGCCGAAPG